MAYPCNAKIYMYNTYLNVYEWRYLLNFFWVLTGQDFAGGTVNEQEETHKSTIFDYTFTDWSLLS